VPTQPPLDGLPLWAQIVISMMIGVATLAVAFRGYFKHESKSADTATIAGATLMDNLSIRLLGDQLTHLSGDIVSLERSIVDHAHWTRSKFEQDREMCQRLRELRETTDRLVEMAERHLK
jgi:hypothetical protein